MAASATDYFMKVGMSTATTLSAPGYTVGNTSVTVASTTNWPTDTGVTFAIDEVETVDGEEQRVVGTYNVFRGTVTSGTQITNVVYVGGDANRNYTAGASTRVYILVSAYRDNRFTDGILVEHTQGGVHQLTSNSTLTSSKVITSLNDTNGNELIKVAPTASAVNEITVTNAATGNDPSIAATGGDTNIDLKLQGKGTGRIQGNVGNIDAWEELGRTTLSSGGDTVSVTGLTAKKYLRATFFGISGGTAIDVLVRFNNDSGTNYSSRYAANQGADTAPTGGTSMILSTSETGDRFVSVDIINVSNKEKLVMGHATSYGATGSGAAPTRWESHGKWVNTSTQVTRVDVINSQAGDYGIGSELIIYGHD